jgi:hypothetical protein
MKKKGVILTNKQIQVSENIELYMIICSLLYFLREKFKRYE